MCDSVGDGEAIKQSQLRIKFAVYSVGNCSNSVGFDKQVNTHPFGKVNKPDENHRIYLEKRQIMTSIDRRFARASLQTKSESSNQIEENNIGDSKQATRERDKKPSKLLERKHLPCVEN